MITPKFRYRLFIVLALVGCTTQESCERDGGSWQVVTTIQTNHCYDHKHHREIVSYEGYCDVREVHGCVGLH